jgi:hypothetical protein
MAYASGLDLDQDFASSGSFEIDLDDFQGLSSGKGYGSA